MASTHNECTTDSTATASLSDRIASGAASTAKQVAQTAAEVAHSVHDGARQIEKEATADYQNWTKPVVLVIAYQLLQEWYTGSWDQDPASWTLTSPMKPAVATVVYFAVLYFGMKYMEPRDPSPRLKKYIITYNLYQVLLNLWCVVGFLHEVFVKHPHPLHFTVEQSSYKLGFLIWVHYNNKFIELLDTVFMVFNKKNNQVSFLHVYHHVLLMWSWWAVCAYGCGGVAWFGAFMNSFIHVLMYGYYTMAALKLPCPWKRVLTQMQMVQFVLCMSAGTYCMYHGYYPFWLSLLNIWVMVNMLVLFGQFYRNKYKSAANSGKAKTA